MNLPTEICNTITELKQIASGSIRHREEIIQVAKKHGATWNQMSTVLINEETRTKKGYYDLSKFFHCDITSPEVIRLSIQVPPLLGPKMASEIMSISNNDQHIPEIDHRYVRWGHYKVVEKVVAAEKFLPLFITGPSGNGKTVMVEQCCARLQREFLRVQMSPETDEDDLIGGFRLIDGQTVFSKGPVIKAMERGCILLIDEVDRGSNKIMCLQGIMEGKPIMIKKTGQVVTPHPNFNVIVTANTKGRGSEDGKYAAASIIDDAFLERFFATLEQEYPSPRIEKTILMNHMEVAEYKDEDFTDKLILWADAIRKTAASGTIDDEISTRRLCHIVELFALFKSRSQAIELAISRYESTTRRAFIELYSKLDPNAGFDIAPVTEESDTTTPV